MARNKRSKLARDAKATRDFFNQPAANFPGPARTKADADSTSTSPDDQVPASASTEDQVPTSTPCTAPVPAPASACSHSLPANPPPCSCHPNEDLPYLPLLTQENLLQDPEPFPVHLLLGKSVSFEVHAVFHEFKLGLTELILARDAADRERTQQYLVEHFKSVYQKSTRPDKASVWTVDTEIIAFLADTASSSSHFLNSFFINGDSSSGLAAKDIVITSKKHVDPDAAVGILTRHLVEEAFDAVKLLDSDQYHPDKYDAVTPLLVVGIFVQTALVKAKSDKPQLFQDWLRVRGSNMSVEGNLVITGKMKDDETATGAGGGPNATKRQKTFRGPRIDASRSKKQLKEGMTEAQAKEHLERHLMKLLDAKYDSPEARRKAFADALEDIKKSQVLATARSLSFPIGGMSGWKGELEQMQAEAFKKEKGRGKEKAYAEPTPDQKGDPELKQKGDQMLKQMGDLTLKQKYNLTLGQQVDPKLEPKDDPKLEQKTKQKEKQKAKGKNKA